MHPTVWAECSAEEFGAAAASFFLYKASSSSLNLKSWEGSGDPPGTSNPNLFILFPFHFHNNCGMSLSVTTSSQLAEIKLWWHLEEPGSHWLSSLAKNWQSEYKDDSCQGNYVTSFCNKAVKNHTNCEPHQIGKKKGFIYNVCSIENTFVVHLRKGMCWEGKVWVHYWTMMEETPLFHRTNTS